jgi:hypothetical protein
MLVKKSPASITTTTVFAIRSVDKQLQDLYSRRSAVESLIESLQEYDRCRTRRLELHKQKTA